MAKLEQLKDKMQETILLHQLIDNFMLKRFVIRECLPIKLVAILEMKARDMLETHYKQWNR